MKKNLVWPLVMTIITLVTFFVVLYITKDKELVFGALTAIGMVIAVAIAVAIALGININAIDLAMAIAGDAGLIAYAIYTTDTFNYTISVIGAITLTLVIIFKDFKNKKIKDNIMYAMQFITTLSPMLYVVL